MKQETLEDAAERLYQYQSQNPPYTIITPKAKIDGFIEGAKWQAERSYSDEEVMHIVSEALQSALVTVDLEQWFKQFKKK
jgi:hypothetical protein